MIIKVIKIVVIVILLIVFARNIVRREGIQYYFKKLYA